jgi:hypothetical protein
MRAKRIKKKLGKLNGRLPSLFNLILLFRFIFNFYFLVTTIFKNIDFIVLSLTLIYQIRQAWSIKLEESSGTWTKGRSML